MARRIHSNLRLLHEERSKALRYRLRHILTCLQLQLMLNIHNRFICNPQMLLRGHHPALQGCRWTLWLILPVNNTEHLQDLQ
jgi:hypothetical protein